MKLLKLTIKILCFVIAVSVMLTAVFFRDNSVKKSKINSDVFVSPVSQNLHSDSNQDFELICFSGFIELYFNKSTSGIAVRELSRDFWWYAMPEGAGNSMITMDVISEKGLYKLNSQDNSVAFSSWSYEIKEDGVLIRYIISSESKAQLQQSDIAFEVSLNVRLKDGSLFTNCSVKKRTGNEACAVSSLSILPGLCSFSNAQKDDFILLPDGCGAVIYPAMCEDTKTFKAKVYGDDYSVNTVDCADAIMGAFGVRKGESAIAVIIDNAEEIATVEAVSNKSGFSNVSAVFNVYDCKTQGNEVYLSGNPYEESISLCFKFLSGDNASYSEIASSCREQFIRNGSLPSADAQSQESVPLYLTLTGSYKSSPWSPVAVSYTTFSQAQDILSRVKAKGVDTIAVRYAGVFKGKSTSLSSSLGNEKDFEELLSFAFSQNISLFIDADILSYQSVMGRFDFSAVKGMDKSASFAVLNTSPDNYSDNRIKLRFRKEADVSDFVADLLHLSEDYGFAGYCIGDGELLVSDYSADNVSRGEMKKTISSQIPAFSNTGEVIVDKGNMYLVKNASGIINLPMSTYYHESEYYVAIPFVQSVLHGRITVSGEPINIQENLTEATLRCIEYGVCPAFTTVYSDKNQKNNVLFDNIINDLVESYTIAGDALFGLESERITSHDKLKDGVYLTTYGDKAKVYVNYNNTPSTVSGVTVPAQSYIRID